MNASYNPADFRKLRDWVAEEGGDMLPTQGAGDWFVRQHRDELVESGELIIRRGAGGSLVGPGFGRKVVEIFLREQQRSAA